MHNFNSSNLPYVICLHVRLARYCAPAEVITPIPASKALTTYIYISLQHLHQSIPNLCLHFTSPINPPLNFGFSRRSIRFSCVITIPKTSAFTLSIHSSVFHFVNPPPNIYIPRHQSIPAFHLVNLCPPHFYFR